MSGLPTKLGTVDLSRSRFEYQNSIKVADGAATPSTGGLVLAAGAAGNRLGARMLTNGDTAASVIGVSIVSHETSIFKAVVKAEYELNAGLDPILLNYGNVVAASVAIAGYTNVGTGATANANEFNVNEASGILTFHAGSTPATVEVSFRYSPSAAELIAEGQAFDRNSAHDMFGDVSVANGDCFIFVNNIDTAASAFTIGGGVRYNVTTGTFNTAVASATNIDVTATFRVSYLPTNTDPFLGLAFSIKPVL